MAKNGNDHRLYAVEASTNTYVAGQTSVNYTMNDELIETSDKLSEWATFISGKKGWSGSCTFNLDNTASAKQIELVKSLKKGMTITIFIGELKEDQQSDGVAGEVYITSVENNADSNAVISRSVNFTGNGEPTIIEPGA